MRYIRSEKRIINEDRELMYMSASKLSSVFHLLGIIHYIAHGHCGTRNLKAILVIAKNYLNISRKII